MLRVKNQNIYITRGETAALEYEAVRRDGIPYILEPIVDKSISLEERKDYAVLALTVKTGANGEIVLAKYLDLEAPPMYEGASDYTKFGFHKFRLRDVQHVSVLPTVPNLDVVYKVDGLDGYWVYITNANVTDKNKYRQYRFKMNIPFLWYDTAKLDPKEYVYDINLYYGKLKPEQIAAIRNEASYDGFPLVEDETLIKIPLVSVHNFIVEDSNNV
jgi:hypothetical protein